MAGTNWSRVGSEVIDWGLMVGLTPGVGAQVQGGLAAATGKTAGELVTGEQSSIGKGAEQLGVSNIFGAQSRQKKKDDQRDLTVQQLQRAGEIEKELNERGNPQMEANLNRQREITALASRYARQGMNEPQRQLATQDIERQQASAIQGASSLGAGLRNMGAVEASTAQRYRELGAQDATIAQQNQGQYLRTLSNLGQAEAAAEQYNKLTPYERKLAEMQALRASSIQNQFAITQTGIDQGQANQQLAMDVAALGVEVAPIFI